MALVLGSVVCRVTLLFTLVSASSGNLRLLQSAEASAALEESRQLEDEFQDTSSAPSPALKDRSNSKVKPFPCSQHSGPLQTLPNGKDGYEVNERTLTGNSTVYDIPRSRTDPPFEKINACGINPIDDILHCIIAIPFASAEDPVPYLVRIDDSMMEFVAKVPQWSWTGTFGPTGTYYYAAKGKYYKIPKVAELIGYPDQNGLNSSPSNDFSQDKGFASLGAGADMVVVNANIEEDEGAADYIMTLSDAGNLRVTRANGQVKSWLLKAKPDLDTNGRSYGAAWAYDNRVFFAQNKAGGMLEVHTDTIDLKAGTVTLEKIGPSFDNGGTDGANCIDIQVPSNYSGQCPKKSDGTILGAYSSVTQSGPFPPNGATNVKLSPDLIFLPSHDDTVTGYQVYLGPTTLKDDGSVDSVEWHLTCNLPCGVNVCRPPYGLDNSLGGNFAWRVDHLKADGSTLQGEVWQFSLMKSTLYEARAIGDVYIDKKPQPYHKKRHMLMRAKTQKNPQFGFVKFDLPPPYFVGPFNQITVMKADLRLTVLSTPMKDIGVYPIHGEKANFTESEVTSESGKHPGPGEYPNVFDGVESVWAYGPVAPKKSFTVDVTESVTKAMNEGGVSPLISFGLETTTAVSRICAQSSENPRKEGWCYPKLEVHLAIGGPTGKIPAGAIPPACSKPADFIPGPLDAMCGSTEPTFIGEPTDWREETAITTTTTTTTTSPIMPIREGQCRYNDHVYCPWPNSDIMCSGDQCCPDQSTCPSSQFAQAQGCNLKKYDCTAPVPANWTCRESEETFCPGTDIKCSGDTCCPNNSTCPSASTLQVPGCGEKMVDCQAPLSADASCAIGEFVFCPASAAADQSAVDTAAKDPESEDVMLSSAPAKQCSAHPKCVALGLEGDCCPATEGGVPLDCCEGTFTYRNEKCAGNQCCPDGSTCPSAPLPIAQDCGPKKQTCELLKWKVSFRVTSIVFDKVDDDTKELVCLLAQETLAAKAAIGSENVECSSKAGSLIVETNISAPGGWSQEKLDDAVKSRVLGEDTRLEMEEMLTEVDGLQEASSGDMVFENVQGSRSDIEESENSEPATTASPESNGASPAPSGTTAGVTNGDSDGLDSGDNGEVSTARAWSLLSAVAVILMSAGI